MAAVCAAGPEPMMQTGVFIVSDVAMAAASLTKEGAKGGFVKKETAARHFNSDLLSINKYS